MLNISFLIEAVFIDNRNIILDATAFHKSTCSAVLLFLTVILLVFAKSVL